jgi:hypothetical protein
MVRKPRSNTSKIALSTKPHWDIAYFAGVFAFFGFFFSRRCLSLLIAVSMPRLDGKYATAKLCSKGPAIRRPVPQRQQRHQIVSVSAEVARGSRQTDLEVTRKEAMNWDAFARAADMRPGDLSGSDSAYL